MHQLVISFQTRSRAVNHQLVEWSKRCNMCMSRTLLTGVSDSRKILGPKAFPGQEVWKFPPGSCHHGAHPALHPRCAGHSSEAGEQTLQCTKPSWNILNNIIFMNIHKYSWIIICFIADGSKNPDTILRLASLWPYGPSHIMSCQQCGSRESCHFPWNSDGKTRRFRCQVPHLYRLSDASRPSGLSQCVLLGWSMAGGPWTLVASFVVLSWWYPLYLSSTPFQVFWWDCVCWLPRGNAESNSIKGGRLA